jgi:hypothetical protein
MLECLIIGDSIAHGLAAARPECINVSSIGINSRNWWNDNGQRPLVNMAEYRTVVISLGSNDLENSDYERWMRKIRDSVKADRVIWLLPSPVKRPKQREVVNIVAWEHRDGVVDLTTLVGPDQIHPPTVAAYETLAKSTR